MKNFPLLLSAAIIAVMASLVTHWMWPSAQGTAKPKETVYERVIRTGTIRCGYGVYDPSIIKDPNTGKLSGIFYDLMEEVGRQLSLKIEWAEDAGYENIAAGFETGRYDVFCAAVWPLPERARVGTFTIPLYYSGLQLFVRADDHRFGKDWHVLNSPEYTLATNDGDVTDSMAKKFFPKAKTYSLPQLADHIQLMTAIETRKADAVVSDITLLNRYNRKNPGKLRLANDNPLQLFPNTMMLPKNEFQLKNMLDVTLQGLLYSGDIERIVNKYTGNEKVVYFPASPIRE